MGPVSYTALTPLSFLERSARVWPGQVAVIYGRRRLTYSEFAAEVARVARALRASGVEPGDRVAYLMPNLPEMLIAHFAVPLAGGVLVAINTRLTAHEVSHILRHSGAKIVVAQIIHSRHDENSVYLWTLPMFHCNGWCTPWALTAIGGTHVCLREVRGDAIWQQLREHGVTHLNAAPTVVSAILTADQAGPLTRPVTITTAGAPPSPTTIAEMERTGFEVVHVYGLTETYGPFTVCQPQPHWAGLPADQRAALQARQGVGMIPAEGLRVVDEEMADVPANGETMGEIVMRGNTVMAGYYLDPKATAQAFRGGWFHSEDLGVMHPDGYIELRDRAKDIVISGGENISTIEVEQALMSHPCVLEAAVIGVPDQRWGERPKAFVVLRSGTTTTPADLIAHVRTQIAGYKAPRDIDITVKLPKTSTGKIQKYMLREKEWSGHASRVQG
jgi:fatty-acyl-CoA synthase